MSLCLGGCGSCEKIKEIFSNTTDYVKTVSIPNEVTYYLYYIKNQQDATLAVLFISHCSAVATDLGHPYWIYIIPTHGMHQWLLLQFLVLLMMDAESVRNM